MDTINPVKLILQIDDEASIRELVQACLSDLAGWHVVAVASAQEGLQWLAVRHPDVILLDVVMPGMDTTTFIQKLHENPATRSIPVILLTGGARWFTSQKLQQLGVLAAIAKPFNPVLLPTLIAQTLGWSLPVEPQILATHPNL